MSKRGEFMLVCDNDCHWYVIPINREPEWWSWVERADEYWNFGIEPEEDSEEPTMPKWAVEVGGAPEKVKFKGWRIE